MRELDSRNVERLEGLALDDDLLIHADNALVLPRLPAGAFDLVSIDPPFNTGRRRERRTLAVTPDANGDRTGFAGRRYRSRLLEALSYEDAYADYLEFLAPRLEEARRLLAPHGTLYFHIDYREAHYCKLLLDEVFGRDCFLNEIIWAYDYGGRPRRTAGPPSTTRSWSTSRSRAPTTSTPRPSIASPTWRRAS